MTLNEARALWGRISISTLNDLSMQATPDDVDLAGALAVSLAAHARESGIELLTDANGILASILGEMKDGEL